MILREEEKKVHILMNGMDNGYMIREKNHQTSKVWAFWACQSAAQTKSIYVEKNAHQITFSSKMAIGNGF